MSDILNCKYDDSINLNESHLFSYEQVYFLTNIKVPTLSAFVQKKIFVKNRDYVKVNTLVRFKRDFVIRLLNEGVEQSKTTES